MASAKRSHQKEGMTETKTHGRDAGPSKQLTVAPIEMDPSTANGYFSSEDLNVGFFPRRDPP